MPSKFYPTDETARNMVERFVHYIADLKAVHRIIKELFTEEEDRRLMDQTASSFFSDLYQICVKYFLLESAKIMDPKKSCGKENFTIDNLLATIDWPEATRQELNDLKQSVDEFKKHIKPARDKILAHYDKSTYLSNEVLGAFPKGCDEGFLIALDKMCNVMHEASSDCICGSIHVGTQGDVRDLKKTLKRAIAFEKLLRESTGEEKYRLYNLSK